MPQGTTPPADAFSKAVNAELRAWIARRRLTQTALADATGIPQQTISKTVYRDAKPLNTNQLGAICAALDISPADILAAAARNVASANASQEDLRLAAKEDEPDVDEGNYY